MIELYEHCNMPKYKGQFWDDVIQQDPNYIKWLIQNLENFELSNDAYAAFKNSCNVHGIDPNDSIAPPDAASRW